VASEVVLDPSVSGTVDPAAPRCSHWPASTTNSWFVLVYPRSFFENFVEHVCSEASSGPNFFYIFSTSRDSLSNMYMEKFTNMSRSTRLTLILRSCWKMPIYSVIILYCILSCCYHVPTVSVEVSFFLLNPSTWFWEFDIGYFVKEQLLLWLTAIWWFNGGYYATQSVVVVKQNPSYSREFPKTLSCGVWLEESIVR
jgi:hypothetical protein